MMTGVEVNMKKNKNPQTVSKNTNKNIIKNNNTQTGNNKKPSPLEDSSNINSFL